MNESIESLTHPDRFPFKSYVGYVSAVRVGGDVSAQAMVREVAEDITYDVVLHSPDAVLQAENIVPHNRRFNKARVIAARVNDMVHATLMDGTLNVLVHTEMDDLYGCDKQPIEP